MKKQDYEVLKVLLDHRHEDEGWMYTFDIGRAMGLKDYQTAKLYVSFARLERDDLVEFRWEHPEATPPRRAQRRAKPDKVPELLEEFERKRRKQERRKPKLGRILNPGGART